MSSKLLMLVMVLMLGFAACTEPFEPDTDTVQPLVVEGFVEAGNGSVPTYVILTRSLPFITSVDGERLEELFVNDAVITVHDGDKTTQLAELCLDDLPPALRLLVAESLNINPNNLLNICAYVDLLDEIKRESGRTYNLRIETGEEILTATTTIPQLVPLYDFSFVDPPGEPSDKYARLLTTIDDPVDQDNFYRYKTAEQNGPLVVPFTSVINDVFFNGQTFEFPLAKAENLQEEVPFDEFGLFTRGDSITIKWMNMDEAHFDFWNTRDFSANSAGPFASYTRIAGNVDGALGIWGGYAVDNYRLYVPFD